MKTEVYLRGENIFKEVSIASNIKSRISGEYLKKWEEILNLIADIIDIPSVLIMRINENTMEVLVNNTNRENPYESEDEEELGCGLYCETVTGKDKELSVENALENDSWKDNPDVDLDMISYYGLPIKLPSNDMFGTICVLDNETRKLSETQKELIKKFKNVIEKDMELLNSQNKLKEKEKLFQKVLNHSIEGIALLDKNFNIKSVNTKFKEIFEYNENELININIKDLIIPEYEYEDFLKYKNQVLGGKDVETVVKRKTKNGDTRIISLNLFKVELSNKETGVYAVYNDITYKRKREKSIKEIKNRLSLAIRGANIGVWDWNIKTGEVHFNENWANMLGYSLDELENSIKTWEKLVYVGDKKRVEKDLNEHLYGNSKIYKNEHRLRNKFGNFKWIRDIGKVTHRDKNGEPIRIVGVHIDIDEKKRYEEKIEYLSFHDDLTGLYNRRYFDQKMVKLKDSNKYPITLIIGDLDKLKEVNDKYGHSLGDYYIKKSAKVLKDLVRKKDTVARIGGDEFAIILTEINKDKIKKIIKRINEELNKINKKEELSVPLSISLGVETADNKNEFKEIFEKVDRKMYENKNLEG